MRKIKFSRISIVVSFLIWLLFVSIMSRVCLGEEQFPFKGQTNDDNVNIRSDSTVGAPIICTVKKASRLDVILEMYEWYKVRLPKQAPAYIKKDLVECIDFKNNESLNTDLTSKTFKRCQNAKVLKNRVNVRFGPNESSPILGQADENEIVNVVSETGDWYKIEPIQNSFGWIHKRFVNKAPAEEAIKLALKAKEEFRLGESVIIEGTIKPYGKIFKRQATHKLVTEDNRIFLLKGDKKGLDALCHHKAKITGKIISNPNQKYPTVEVKILEVID